jgi:hypothetical protein
MFFSDTFPIKNGLNAKCVLSSLIFSFALNLPLVRYKPAGGSKIECYTLVSSLC